MRASRRHVLDQVERPIFVGLPPTDGLFYALGEQIWFFPASLRQHISVEIFSCLSDNGTEALQTGLCSSYGTSSNIHDKMSFVGTGIVSSARKTIVIANMP